MKEFFNRQKIKQKKNQKNKKILKEEISKKQKMKEIFLNRQKIKQKTKKRGKISKKEISKKTKN